MSTVAPQDAPKQLSNRSFGLIFAVIFSGIALWPMLFGGDVRQWAAIAAGLFAVPALLIPKVLQPLNNLWVKFGFLMHSIINPILMGLIFFIAVLPTGLLVKLLAKDPMRRRYEPDSASYWIERADGRFDKERFKNQF